MLVNMFSCTHIQTCPPAKVLPTMSLGRILKVQSSKEIADAQAMNSGGNNQSDVDDLLVEECSSDGK